MPENQKYAHREKPTQIYRMNEFIIKKLTKWK